MDKLYLNKIITDKSDQAIGPELQNAPMEAFHLFAKVAK